MALHSLYCADVPLRNCSLTLTQSTRYDSKDFLVVWIKKDFTYSLIITST